MVACHDLTTDARLQEALLQLQLQLQLRRGTAFFARKLRPSSQAGARERKDGSAGATDRGASNATSTAPGGPGGMRIYDPRAASGAGKQRWPGMAAGP
ncbi:hypothetical protein ACFUCV_06555 [Specibacter sp. NPDC057265]|uniref:hypothetical protein n=1 Tax=Specibacter sp. NPDC057265 TaxID=3346075 RepID=UPI003645A532